MTTHPTYQSVIDAERAHRGAVEVWTQASVAYHANRTDANAAVVDAAYYAASQLYTAYRIACRAYFHPTYR